MPENLTNPNQTDVKETPIVFEAISWNNDFHERLKAIASESALAQFLLSLRNKSIYCVPAIKSSTNFFGISSDDPTKISYSTYERIFASRKNMDNRAWEDKNYRYHSKAGKVIKKLLSTIKLKEAESTPYFAEISGMVTEFLYEEKIKPVDNLPSLVCDLFTEADYDSFNNLFRIQGFKQGDTGEVTYVKGHWIAEFYLEKNYASMSGDLGNSCMRYPKTNAYLDIYTKNPFVCKMAVLFNTEGKVQARALVWTVDGVDYHDRIYATSDLIRDRMKAFFLVNSIETCYSGYPNYCNIVIKADLKNKNFDERVILSHNTYPYADSLRFLSGKEDCLTTDPDLFRGTFYVLNRTSGEYEEVKGEPQETCDCCGTEVSLDNTAHISIYGDYYRGEILCLDCCNYSDYHNGYISERSSVFIEDLGYILESELVRDYTDSWIIKTQAVLVREEIYAHHNDPNLRVFDSGEYFLEGDDFYEVVEYQNRYYEKYKCVETRSGDYVPIDFTIEKDGEVWEISKLQEHDNLNLI